MELKLDSQTFAEEPSFYTFRPRLLREVEHCLHTVENRTESTLGHRHVETFMNVHVVTQKVFKENA